MKPIAVCSIGYYITKNNFLKNCADIFAQHEKNSYICSVIKNQPLRCQQDKVDNKIMANVIFTNREIDSNEWITVSKGRKYLTLEYLTCYQGQRDYTVTYSLDDEEELLETLSEICCNIECIVEHGWGPEPIKVVKHGIVR